MELVSPDPDRSRAPTPEFVFGVDLDGVCTDFYGRMREIAAEWMGVPLDSLTTEVGWSLTEWGLQAGGPDYLKLHRFAVTQRQFFLSMDPMPGVGPVLRRLSRRGVRIRIITHRLFVEHFHQIAVAQTVQWLDNYGIPYWDLCFMGQKGAVDADLYIDDMPNNIESLRAKGKDVIAFTAPVNRSIILPSDCRADSWQAVEPLVLARLEARGL